MEIKAEEAPSCHIGHQHQETIPVVDAILEILFCHTSHWKGVADVVDFEGEHREMVKNVVSDTKNETSTSTWILAFLRTLEQSVDCANVAAVVAAVKHAVSASVNEIGNAAVLETMTVTWNGKNACQQAEISATSLTAAETEIFWILAVDQLKDF